MNLNNFAIATITFLNDNQPMHNVYKLLSMLAIHAYNYFFKSFEKQKISSLKGFYLMSVITSKDNKASSVIDNVHFCKIPTYGWITNL